MLSKNANLRININVNNCVFSTDGVFFSVTILENVHVFLHFGIILRYIWFHKMLMKYGGMMFRIFFSYVFCVHFAKYLAKHVLPEMILLRGELGRIIFDVGRRVQEYMHTLLPPPSLLCSIHRKKIFK